MTQSDEYLTRIQAAFVLGVEIGPHLDELLAAIDAQSFGRDRVRVVLADVGAEPEDVATARAWVQRDAGRGELLTGLTSSIEARRAVLARAGDDDWVSFPESQDAFGPDYLSDVARAVEQADEASIVVARQRRWDPDTGAESTTAALDAPFRDGTATVVSLVSQPEDAPVTLRTAFVRAAHLQESDAEPDPRLEAGFADQVLMLRVLASRPHPTCVYVDTTYRFRTRDDVAAGGRESFSRPERFTDVVRHGHLELLASFGELGAAPEFVQHAVLLDLGWYFRADEGLTGQMNAEMHHVHDEFHALVTQVLALIDPSVLDSVELPRMPLDRYVALRHGYAGADWHEDPVILDQRDARQGLVRLTYRFAGAQPVERLTVDGEAAEPRFAKTRRIVYAGRALAFERILWVSGAGRIALMLDGEAVAIGKVRAPRRRTSWSPRAVADALGARRPAATKLASSPRSLVGRLVDPTSWRNWLIRLLAGSGPVRRRFGGSWVLMDRVESGHDNAEHLFAHLQRTEPGIRSWFAVEKGTKDWQRLTAQGHKNLLAYGSWKWMLVCLNATHVISSQAGPYVDNPVALRPIRRPSWRFIFLQHGVIATDLHRWLNRRTFDLFITTTHDEYASIAGDQALYRYTPHEVALTGLPRHDRLVRMDSELDPSARRRILVLPTWREYLLGPLIPGTGRRELREDFAETTYAQAWFGLLRSDALRDLAAEHGATIAFMPHPNVQPYLDQFDLPSYVETLTYADNDIQEVLTSAKVVVTDFSSIVFDAAYIGRPIIYYQFDQAEAFGGTHTVRQGYFSYELDGFGPVVQAETEVIDALVEIAAAGFEASPEHGRRRDATFPVRDDGSSARVVDAIRALDVHLSPQDAATSVDVPKAPPNRPTPRA